MQKSSRSVPIAEATTCRGAHRNGVKTGAKLIADAEDFKRALLAAPKFQKAAGRLIDDNQKEKAHKAVNVSPVKTGLGKSLSKCLMQQTKDCSHKGHII